MRTRLLFKAHIIAHEAGGHTGYFQSGQMRFPRRRKRHSSMTSRVPACVAQTVRRMILFAQGIDFRQREEQHMI
jgi:hypothetical protein